MHTIEPYYSWQHIYQASEDELSPFYQREYSEFVFSDKIYNYYIHPQWDYIESPTLYLKILIADYINEFAVIELFGEWNDAVNNDIMFLKNNVLDKLKINGINQFILIAENVLNFHASDDCYYEELHEDLSASNGWLVLLNLRPHIIEEMQTINLNRFVLFGEHLNEYNWRANDKPEFLFEQIKNLFEHDYQLIE